MNNRSVFWGFFLVLLGLVYLLRQFGFIYFHITWLFAWKLWPVILIIAGLRLILPRSSNLAGSLILVVMIALFAYVIFEGYTMKKEGKIDDSPSWLHKPNEQDDDDDKPDADDNDNSGEKGHPNGTRSMLLNSCCSYPIKTNER